jgi:hypothetical protein
MRLSYIKLIIKCCWGKKINLAINLKHHVMKQSQELNDARLQQYIRLARKPLRMVHKCRHKHFLNYLRHPRRSCSICDMNERTKKNKQMTFFLTCICMIRIFASRERFFFLLFLVSEINPPFWQALKLNVAFPASKQFFFFVFLFLKEKNKLL